MSYQASESKAVAAIKKAIPPSLKRNMLKSSKGMFAELYENDEVFPRHYCACAIDGVGTKVIIAEAMGKYDTIGIDCVAMTANDLATLGRVSPFLYMDYLACQSKIQEEEISGDIIKGMSRGLEMCDASSILRNSIKINFGKGETASVNELMSSTKPGYGFDIAGAMIGFVEKKALKTTVEHSDVIIALPSSGAHSNGYTDLRHHLLKGDFETRPAFKKAYKGKYKLDDSVNGMKLGKALLEPTRIYVKDIAAIAKEFPIVGVNNTGYGLKNFNRVSGNVQFIIDNPLEPQPLFTLMQKESTFSDEQMYSAFNMGMGFFIIAKKNDAESIVKKSKGAAVVGHVEKAAKKGTILIKNGRKIFFEGY
jgi:phosphoribosylformylglycinamidine cyclo-ligase